MHYKTYGKRKNPVVLFMHGWGGSLESWGIIPMKIASFGFFSIVVDFPGFGKSPEPEREYSVYDYAVEVRKLLEELEVSNCSIVGHSFGGRVAIKIAGEKLIQVNKLVLVDSAGIRPKRNLGYYCKVWRYKSLKRKVQAGKADSRKLEKYGSSDYRVLSPVMRRTFVLVVNESLLECAKKIENETLLIWGRNDKDTPLYMAKKFKRMIKNSRLEIYDTGHFSYLENMDEFIDELYLFLCLGR